MQLNSLRKAVLVLGMSLAAHFAVPNEAAAREGGCVLCENWCTTNPGLECLLRCPGTSASGCGWTSFTCYGQYTIFCTQNAE